MGYHKTLKFTLNTPEPNETDYKSNAGLRGRLQVKYTVVRRRCRSFRQPSVRAGCSRLTVELRRKSNVVASESLNFATPVGRTKHFGIS